MPIALPPHLPENLRARLTQGRRVQTPFASGRQLTWHVWTPAGIGSGMPPPPVVLLHGGSGSWTHWVRNIGDLLDSGRTVWAVDLPGFGASDALTRGTDADAMLLPLAQGLSAVLGEAAFDLVGFSFGGLTAGLLMAWLVAGHGAAEGRRLNVCQLVLVGAPGMGITPGRQFQLKGWRHLTDERERLAVHRYNLGELMLHAPAAIDELAVAIQLDNVARDRAPRRRLAHTDALAQALPHIVVPVHAIYGAHDALYGRWINELAPAYARACPRFQGLELVPEAGHWVQFEAPSAFHSALIRALDSQRG